jgi:hypothetical protein
MGDLSPRIDPAAATRLLAHVDIERKLPRALASLGPVADRDVLIVDGRPGTVVAALVEAGARVIVAAADPEPLTAFGTGVAQVVPGTSREVPMPDASVDVVIGMHSVYRGVDVQEQAEADRLLRGGGRLLVVHDYGRDDVASLAPADLPEYTEWSRRGGPFLRAGFRMRVIHCWWTFADTDEATEVLAAALGPGGASLASALRRPRVSYNVAIYHRDRAATRSAGQRAREAPGAMRRAEGPGLPAASDAPRDVGEPSLPSAAPAAAPSRGPTDRPVLRCPA